MGAGKNKSHRKKRISKHVLQAKERKKIAEVEKKLTDDADKKDGSDVLPTNPDTSNSLENPSSTAAATAASSSSSSSPAVVTTATVTKTKNPEEASTYLSLWKYDRYGTTKNDKNKQWKFNKNTQSWLLRHMYDPTKVSKHSFALLVEYLLHGGNNDGVKNRVVEDAKVRARRYKEFEKELQQQPSKVQENGDAGKGVEATDGNKEEKGGTNQSFSSKKDAVVDMTWKTMDEHEKRKEYKRARKVLDAFKEAAVVRDGDEGE